MSGHEFDYALRIIAADGVTEVFDFHNHDQGLSVVSREEPGDETTKSRVEADHVDGDYDVQERDAAGDYVVVVRVQGDSWAECNERWQAARTAYRSAARYYLETEIEGVKTRYSTGRPDSVQPGQPDLLNCRQTYAIRWHVQPNPTITIV